MKYTIRSIIPTISCDTFNMKYTIRSIIPTLSSDTFTMKWEEGVEKGEKKEVGENLAEEFSQPLLKFWGPLSKGK